MTETMDDKAMNLKCQEMASALNETILDMIGKHEQSGVDAADSALVKMSATAQIMENELVSFCLVRQVAGEYDHRSFLVNTMANLHSRVVERLKNLNSTEEWGMPQ